MKNNITMLTIKEAGKLIPGLTEYRIRAMCLNGELPCIKAGKKFFINQNMLYRYLNGELTYGIVNNPDKPTIKPVTL